MPDDPITSADLLFARLSGAERCGHARPEVFLDRSLQRLAVARARRGLVRRPGDGAARDVMAHVADVAPEDHADAHAFLTRFLGASRDYGGLPIFRAARAAAAPARPALIALGGLSGVGKSTIAAGLAPQLGAPGAVAVVSTDVARKRMHRIAPEERLHPSAYEPAVSERVYRRLRVDARRALVAGADVAVEATFADPRGRAEIASLAASLGVRFFGFWLSVADDTRLARVHDRAEAAAADPAATQGSDAGVEVARAQRVIGKLTWRRLSTARPAWEVAAEIARAIRHRGGERG